MGKEEGVPQGVTLGQRFQQLEYTQAHGGDCKVPRRYSTNPQFGVWVNEQCQRLVMNVKLNWTRLDWMHSTGENKASSMKRKTTSRPLITTRRRKRKE
jgi:hypothetical protein